MKGMALALETIVVLIIAGSVLSLMLFFLYSNAGPAQDQTALERQRSLYCGSYLNTDPKCEGVAGGAPGSPRVPKHSSALTNIKDICTTINERGWGTYPACTSVADTSRPEMLSCIKECCSLWCR